MLVTVTDIQNSADRHFVRVQTPFGPAEGFWETELPQAGVAYEVEVEIPGVLSWGVDIVAVADVEPLIEMHGGATRACGLLERFEDDGVAVLRMGSSLVLVNTSGAAPAVGSYVCLVVPRIHLYDVRT